MLARTAQQHLNRQTRDVIVNLLPPEKRKRVILFAIACGAFFTAVVAAFGITFVAQMYATGQQSYDLEWPMWAIYLAIPVGSALMSFRTPMRALGGFVLWVAPPSKRAGGKSRGSCASAGWALAGLDKKQSPDCAAVK